MTSPPSTRTTTPETKLAPVTTKPCEGGQAEKNPDDRKVRLVFFNLFDRERGKIDSSFFFRSRFRALSLSAISIARGVSMLK